MPTPASSSTRPAFNEKLHGWESTVRSAHSDAVPSGAAGTTPRTTACRWLGCTVRSGAVEPAESRLCVFLRPFPWSGIKAHPSFLPLHQLVSVGS
jgi:hypothetical protein